MDQKLLGQLCLILFVSGVICVLWAGSPLMRLAWRSLANRLGERCTLCWWDGPEGHRAFVRKRMFEFFVRAIAGTGCLIAARYYLMPDSGFYASAGTLASLSLIVMGGLLILSVLWQLGKTALLCLWNPEEAADSEEFGEMHSRFWRRLIAAILCFAAAGQFEPATITLGQTPTPAAETPSQLDSWPQNLRRSPSGARLEHDI